MKSFLNTDRPLITTMLKPDNAPELIRDIKAALKEGTDAFCFEIEIMKTEYRTPEYFKAIFDAMEDKPAYITDYRRLNVSEKEQTDDELTAEMLTALDCGATLFDVRGDLYDVRTDEYTTDPEAVKKQMQLIDELHSRGAEVLMSTHTLEYTPADRVIEIAKGQQERGADIAKIVTAANNDKELDEAFEITLRLKKEIEIPTLFLCIGSHCKKHRLLGPAFGSHLFLAVQKGYDGGAQPQMSDAKNILSTLGYTNLP